MVPIHTANDKTTKYPQHISLEEVPASSGIIVEDEAPARCPNSSFRWSRPVSESSTVSVRVTRHAQEQTRSEYLQAQGFASALSRSSTESGGSSSRTDVSEKVRAIQRRLDASPQLQDEVTDSTVSGYMESGGSYINDVEASGTSRGETCVTNSGIRASYLQGSMAVSSRDDNGATAVKPAQNRYRLRTGFKAARNAEAGNWYSARGSKTLPRRFAHPEGLPGSPSSSSKSSRASLADFGLSRYVPIERSSRAASLRMRNSRLPPGYALPKDSTTLIVASAPLQDSAGRIPEGPSGHAPPRRHSVAPLIPNREDKATDTPDSLSWGSTLGTVRRPARDLTVDTTISAGLIFLECDGGSQRNSRFSETSEEVNVEDRPEVPPKSPDRPSVRDRTLQSNRDSLVWSIPEPADPPLLERPAAERTKKTKKKRSPWQSDFILAVLWAIPTALTIFGISNTSPLHQHSASTLGQARMCTPPSLSFVHNLQMNTTLPMPLQPYLPSLQLGDKEDVDLADHGLKLLVYSSESTQQLQIYSGLVIGTVFVESGVRLQSNITYAGVIDGNEDEAEARRLLDAMLREARAGRPEDAVKIVSAQGASRNVTMPGDGKSIGVFLAFWSACLLAIEATLLAFFAVLPILWATAMWCCQGRRLNSEESNNMEGRQIGWKQKLLSTSTLALQWALAGALGSALAGGVLMVFWTGA